jgi:LmbE family N-acetylglucosaminyl deacetylase
MKTVNTINGVRQLGTIMSIWAHPDDESYSCAGIMAAARANGQAIICVTATKGEAGVQDASRWPPDKLGQIRAEEMAETLKILGVSEHHWLDYPDGGCQNVPDSRAVPRIRELIERYRPDSILTFGSEGMTGHPDHCKISHWTNLAAVDSGAAVYHSVLLPDVYEHFKEADKQFNIFFNIDQPPLCEADECAIMLRLPDALLIKKYQCLCAMPSQTDAMFRQFGQEIICEMICTESFVRAEAGS